MWASDPCDTHSSSPALGKDLPQHPMSIEHHEEVSEEQSGKVGVVERRERGWKQGSEIAGAMVRKERSVAAKHAKLMLSL